MIKFNKTQFAAMIIGSLTFLSLFVADAFFGFRVGYITLLAIVVALTIFVYVFRDKKNSN
jgi:hypothetical protein